MRRQTDPTLQPDSTRTRDHGGGIDAAAVRWGGTRRDWLDLSTGINPVPYPVPGLSAQCWADLPDSQALARLKLACRRHWDVPDHLEILPVPGASAAIARLPALGSPGRVSIPGPTYNEHAAAFRKAGWSVTEKLAGADATVIVHPNNPDGRLWTAAEVPGHGFLVIDESFCDVTPEQSILHALADRPGTIFLKSFGKFWGLAGLRLGFVIAPRDIALALADDIGPWAVSGPALEIGAAALEDVAWTRATRDRLQHDSRRLDAILARAGAQLVGGTTLFRLHDVGDAESMQDRLASARIWTRRFPYSKRGIRFGLPGNEAGWHRLEAALA